MTEPSAPHRFTDYSPRKLGVFRQGYSLFVRIMKFALPLAAVAIVGVLITRMTSSTPQLQNLAAQPQAEKTTPGLIEMVQPKYEGIDEKGRPYTVTADKVTRAVDTPDTVLFANPVADITLADKTWLAAQARTGTLDRATAILDLKDDVSIFHDSGYELHAQDLRIYLKLKTARTSLPVQAQGPIGTLAAKSLDVLDQGDLIIFGGPATLTFFTLPGGGSSPHRKARG